ncbi:MAG: UTP--glucose-1-phosphate uridylyltransferase [Gemmatimonadota bacterium]|nr:MAG: UTP--glucose-1-phosphate uridylyltransferase [Gemmatimonadota bacterium]
MTATSFDAFESKMSAADLPPLAIRTFRHYLEQLEAGNRGTLSRADIEPVDSVPDAEQLTGTRERGREALARTVVVKLNGGLGTSMGLTRAKSLLPVKQGLSFLDIIARQVLHHRRTHGVELPLVFMNSFRTRDDTLRVLANYEELAGPIAADFLQHKVPKILSEDLSVARWAHAPEHEWCPPGHGDIYTALVTSGLLEQLLAAGFEYAFVSNSDNLGAVLDLDILGMFAEEELPFLMEVADRTEADKKGGHLARLQSGGLTLREVAQCPPDEMESFQDTSLFRYFNTNTLWVNLRTLDRVMKEREHVLGLPLIVNEKPIDPTDETSPRVFQLETAMGAAISVFEGAAAIRVPRERFLPVKTTNDLLALWSDVYIMDEEHRVVPAPSRAVGDLVIDLDPRFYKRIDQLQIRFPKGAPSLMNCRRLQIHGDIRFGMHCVFLGEVALRHELPEPRVVPDGEVFG